MEIKAKILCDSCISSGYAKARLNEAAMSNGLCLLSEDIESECINLSEFENGWFSSSIGGFVIFGVNLPNKKTYFLSRERFDAFVLEIANLMLKKEKQEDGYHGN